MRPDLALISLAAVTAAGCAQAEAPGNQPAANVVQAPATPAEHAQRLVAQRLGNAQNLSFGEAQVFVSNGATVVCGRYQQAGQPAQRYVAVGEEDVFIEGEFVGDMNQAVAEACRNI
ncbi:MAG: hypothetical protein ACK4SZ_10530 [Allosphingosinicella sp.]|uniref:hypothetical protein n=1 Tax=Allosphingosinicella sp. TaxID=2823234 RepID=UPI003954A32D